MVRGILGKKVGMTQIFDDDGRVVPVTIVEAGPCVVIQRKSVDNDGYEAVQLGLVERTPRRNAPKAIQGHFSKAGVPPTRILAEVPVDADDELHVVGRSKGRGFQGVIKRHGFGGGRASHSSMFHRAPGSIGRSAWPSRVFPGQGMPGQMGNKRAKIKNARVVKVDADRNLLFIKGGVPGSRNSYVQILKAS